jgi:transketolase
VFFHNLRFDVQNPSNILNDRFVMSKGHGVPVIWAAWAEAGAFPVSDLLDLRKIDSPLEGHPTPRSPWADVATGSLGQGLSIGMGMAIGAKMDATGASIYTLMGDGELAEGSVWEAAMLASHRKLDNLVAILDINRLGQSQETMYGSDAGVYQQRFESFGWKTETVNGHDMEQILAALDRAKNHCGSPYAIVAKTLKGKGVSFMENQDGWHGKPIPRGEMLDQALLELEKEKETFQPLKIKPPTGTLKKSTPSGPVSSPEIPAETIMATRVAYGAALQKLGQANPRIVVLDADTKNSTYSQEFLKAFPERFIECFIAEQNLVGASVGLSVMGKIPFASTFACFFSRAYDQIRMGGISQSNLKLCGSHCGISIGPDGPSQMGLEDIAIMRAVVGSTVFYPCDAISTHRLVSLAAETRGIFYIRTSRPKTPLVYDNNTEFCIGGSHVVRQSPADRATIVSAGVTLHHALEAQETLAAEGIPVRVIDLYCVKPVDQPTLRQAARETNRILTVEDHYPEGGLGDAVLGAIANVPCQYRKIAVTGLPRSGPSDALLKKFGLDSSSIATAVRKMLLDEVSA